MIGSKFLARFFNQSEAKPKPIVARACTFSRALCRLRVTNLEFWLAKVITLVLALRHSIETRSISTNDNDQHPQFLYSLLRRDNTQNVNAPKETLNFNNDFKGDRWSQYKNISAPKVFHYWLENFCAGNPVRGRGSFKRLLNSVVFI